LLLRNFNNQCIDRNPTIAEVIKPTTNTGKNSVRLGTLSKSLMLMTPAPNIIGIDIKKENFAASSLLSFRSIPAEIVAPERDSPGKIART
jgi:hypothetical protein